MATKSWWHNRYKARESQTWVTEPRNGTQVGVLALPLLGDLEQVTELPLAPLRQLGNRQVGLMISKVPPGFKHSGYL